MYITQKIAERIKKQAKLNKKAIKVVTEECDIGINAISEFGKGKEISCITLAKIADSVNCSVDYLLGRTDNPNINI